MEDNTPLVVDLDGTLVSSDMLIESGIHHYKSNITDLLNLPALIRKGKAKLKSTLAENFDFDAATLPYSPKTLSYINEQKKSGRTIVLATASDYRIAEKIAEHLGLFDLVLSTRNDVNLNSTVKAEKLLELFGEKNFDYMGNSFDDIAVWQHAREAIVVNPERGVLKEARRTAEVANVLTDGNNKLKDYAKALRLHQWAKNTLIFLPLLAAHQFSSIDKVVDGFIAFILFGMCASSVYLINDLLDIQDDRHHHSKKNRPLASGKISLQHAVFLAPALCLTSFAAAIILLPALFTVCLATYMALTSLYSVILKRVLFIDVITLAMLYTQRIIAGVAVFEVKLSFWLLALSTFVFLSLALVKRYTELIAARNANKLGKTKGRGYHTDDIELISSLGGSAGYISALVLALYIQDPATTSLYSNPEIIWLACPVLLYWISRTWILAHRGEMNDDPVVFAMRDKVSLICGMIFAVIFWVAT